VKREDLSIHPALLLVLAVLVYILPILVALYRHHQQYAIAALSLLLGWTVIGWVIALV